MNEVAHRDVSFDPDQERNEQIAMTVALNSWISAGVPKREGNCKLAHILACYNLIFTYTCMMTVAGSLPKTPTGLRSASAFNRKHPNLSCCNKSF
jgi:hypothetical protein